ncbi:uncharacterized protein LOC126896466 [Daktulosphaira vitifoliae]|uniref:uncharacterized protein LOC126896466 n=1 Tax=Daktulosphaira vitifoliae TaxID=58002 RepID=UPI0021A9D2E3|nr:uncharacterized protein LOC126896466 [Daktulosphaira vitifoliae]XP_050525237.1 uncharacterized protein LOC126896466 [Daktulosphaira vitifoliae]
MAIETRNSGKPRQVRGTPAYKYRNIFVFGTLAFSGLSWLIYDLLPPTKKLKERIQNGMFDRTAEQEHRMELFRRNLNPDQKDLMMKKAEIMYRKEDPPELIKV